MSKRKATDEPLDGERKAKTAKTDKTAKKKERVKRWYVSKDKDKPISLVWVAVTLKAQPRTTTRQGKTTLPGPRVLAAFTSSPYAQLYPVLPERVFASREEAQTFRDA